MCGSQQNKQSIRHQAWASGATMAVGFRRFTFFCFLFSLRRSVCLFAVCLSVCLSVCLPVLFYCRCCFTANALKRTKQGPPNFSTLEPGASVVPPKSASIFDIIFDMCFCKILLDCGSLLSSILASFSIMMALLFRACSAYIFYHFGMGSVDLCTIFELLLMISKVRSLTLLNLAS